MYRRSLSLVESLLHLAEQGHYEEVMEMLKQPMKHCPEILFLSVIRTQVRAVPAVCNVVTISQTISPTVWMEIGTARSNLQAVTSLHFKPFLIFNCSS